MSFFSRLIIAFAAIILLTLLLSLTFFSFVIGKIQEDASNKTTDRLETVTKSASDAIVQQSALSYSFGQIQNILEFDANLLDVRMLLVDSQGLVRADSKSNSSQSIIGMTISNYKLTPRDGNAYSHYIALDGVQWFYYSRPGPTFNILSSNVIQNNVYLLSASTQSQAQQQLQTDLWLAIPQSEISTDWRDIAKGLIPAATGALLLAIALAFFIARSVAKPVQRITFASTQIAQGNYEQRLPIQGWSEIAHLATSFNKMVSDVGRVQKTLRDFVANVSHELKTPLTSIQGYSQAILDKVVEDPTGIERSVTVIYQEAARMRRLVDDLLDLSRVESGQVEIIQNEVDIRHLLIEILIRLEPQSTDKDLVIQTNFNQLSSVYVIGDKERLEQVFTNILDNAIKYSKYNSVVTLDITHKSGSVEILASNFQRAKESNKKIVVVKVSNYGPLIPSEQLTRIFERFYKLDPSRKRKGESTGLGLAITKELVEIHKGIIYVTSEPTGVPNEGLTTFIITFPSVSPKKDKEKF